jgi:hypothetical protein
MKYRWRLHPCSSVTLSQVAGEYEDLECMCDALSDSCEGWGFGDWALMVKTLEDDDDEALLEEQKETLARLLAASLRLAPDDAAAATSAPKGRKSGGGDDASGVSVVLAALPGLVSRLGLNSGILSALLDVVSSIPVSKGLSTKHAKSLGKVVDVVSEAAVKSQDARVVKNAALALSKIASSPPGILALIDSHFAALADTLWKQASTGLASVSKGSRPSAAATMGIKYAPPSTSTFPHLQSAPKLWMHMRIHSHGTSLGFRVEAPNPWMHTRMQSHGTRHVIDFERLDS